MLTLLIFQTCEVPSKLGTVYHYRLTHEVRRAYRLAQGHTGFRVMGVILSVSHSAYDICDGE